MSIFNDHISSHPLEVFHNTISNWIDKNFLDIWKNQGHENPAFTACEFNSILGRTETQILFANYGMYCMWVHLDRLNINDIKYIKLTLYYSDTPGFYVHKKARVFIEKIFTI